MGLTGGIQLQLISPENMVSQGRFKLPTFPLGGQNFPVFTKVRLKRGCISALVSCLALARAFGQPLAMQGSTTALKSQMK